MGTIVGTGGKLVYSRVTEQRILEEEADTQITSVAEDSNSNEQEIIDDVAETNSSDLTAEEQSIEPLTEDEAKQKEWMAAYKAFLTENQFGDNALYDFIYLDDDSIPELGVTDQESYYSLYYYDGAGIQTIKVFDEWSQSYVDSYFGRGTWGQLGFYYKRDGYLVHRSTDFPVPGVTEFHEIYSYQDGVLQLDMTVGRVGEEDLNADPPVRTVGDEYVLYFTIDGTSVSKSQYEETLLPWFNGQDHPLPADLSGNLTEKQLLLALEDPDQAIQIAEEVTLLEPSLSVIPKPSDANVY